MVLGGGEDLAELSGMSPMQVRVLKTSRRGLFYGVAGVWRRPAGAAAP